MRRAIGLCVLTVLVAGSAHAVDFTWAATATTRWNTASAWNPSDRYPGYYSSSPGTAAQQTFGAGDCVTISNGVRINAGGLVYIYVGNFTLTGTTFHYEVTGNHPNLYCLDDNGHNGDFTLGNAGDYYASGNIYVDGDVKTIGTGTINNNTKPTLTMQGGGKAQTIDYAGAYCFAKIVIDTGANVTQTNNIPKTNSLDVKGNFTGTVLVGFDGSGTYTVGNTGTWGTGELQIRKANVSSGTDVTKTSNVRIGAGTYPNINTLPADPSCAPSSNRRSRQNTYQMGDVTVAGNLKFNNGYAGSTSSAKNWIDTWHTDNGSGGVYNLTVNGNFTAGGGGAYTYGGADCSTIYAGFYANSSTIDINGNASFGRYAYVVGDTSTWKFAGNVFFDTTIYTGTGWRTGLTYFCFENSTMSGTTVVLDGATDQTVDIGTRLKLGNIIVKRGGGTLTLDDNILLAGDFTIDPGDLTSAYNPQGNIIIFAGGKNTEATAQQLSANGADLVNVWLKASSETYVTLTSNLVVSDNLLIDAGCRLYLNGYTLVAEGQTLVSDQIESMSWDNGMIVGTIPEPGTLLLVGTGILATLGILRRRRMI